MMQRSWLKLLISFLALQMLAGCALLGGNEDPVNKNTEIKFNEPRKPFARVNVSSADHVWQSESTGNTIAVNSMCQKYADVSLKDLEQNILSGIENLAVKSERMMTFDGREAKRVLAEGTIDGVGINIDLMILKKNNCTYDLAYIARKNTFVKEQDHFDKFLAGFKAP